MSLDPQQRLDALRAEVLAEAPAPGPEPSSPGVARSPVSTPAAPAPSPQPAPPHDTPAIPGTPPQPAATPSTPSQGGWDIRGLLSDASVSTWLGIALLALGGYLVLSWIVPGIELLGGVVLLGAGGLLLAQNLLRGGAPWTLYAGAVLAGIGGARLVGALLPGTWRGLTAAGVGVAFLAIGYLRHTQAGGYGWQGLVGGALLGLGVIQLVLGWLPGTPGLLDLALPTVLLGAGALLVLRTRGASSGSRPPVS